MAFIQQRQKLRIGWSCVGEVEVTFVWTQRYERIQWGLNELVWYGIEELLLVMGPVVSDEVGSGLEYWYVGLEGENSGLS